MEKNGPFDGSKIEVNGNSIQILCWRCAKNRNKPANQFGVGRNMIVEITVGNFTWRAQMSLNQTKYMQAFFFLGMHAIGTELKWAYLYSLN